MQDLDFWAYLIAGLILFGAFCLYVLLPIFLSYGDQRLLEVIPIDPRSGPISPCGEARQEAISEYFKEQGAFDEAGTRLLLLSESTSGKVWFCYVAFAHREEPVIGWRAFTFGETAEGATHTEVTLDVNLLTAFEDGTFLHTVVGMGPDIPGCDKVVSLWWRGETLEGATQKHIEWMKASGRVPRTDFVPDAADFVAHYRAEMTREGLKSGTAVLSKGGTRYRLSIPFLRRMTWESLPPGIWFRRNQPPGK